MNKLDLTVLNVLVKELNQMALSLEKLKENSGTDSIVEFSKAAGVASGISSEAAALVGDIKHIIKACSCPQDQGPGRDLNDTLMELFAPKPQKN